MWHVERTISHVSIISQISIIHSQSYTVQLKHKQTKQENKKQKENVLYPMYSSAITIGLFY